jgi:hypothetical protein
VSLMHRLTQPAALLRLASSDRRYMNIYTYQAIVRVPTAGGGNMVITTQVQAENETTARFLLEAQYGFGNVLHLPQRVY